MQAPSDFEQIERIFEQIMKALSALTANSWFVFYVVTSDNYGTKNGYHKWLVVQYSMTKKW